MVYKHYVCPICGKDFDEKVNAELCINANAEEDYIEHTKECFNDCITRIQQDFAIHYKYDDYACRTVAMLRKKG